MINGKITECKFKSVELVEPDVIKVIKDDGTSSIYVLGKESLNFIYGRMGVPYSMCKKLYYSSKDLWKKLMDEKLFQNENIKSLSKYRYVIYDKLAFAMIEEDYDSIDINYDLFDQALSNNAHVSINENEMLIKTIFTNTSDGNTSLVLVDLYLVSGWYTAYNAAFIDGCIVPLGRPITQSYKFFDFMTSFDVVQEISMSAKMFNNIKNIFNDPTLENKELSVREIIDTINKTKCSINLDQNKFIASIDLVNSDKIVEFLNSFGMPYKSLKKLPYLKKSLTYNSFTIKDLIEILSRNYKLDTNVIDSYMMSNIVNQYLDQKTDKNIYESCLD